MFAHDILSRHESGKGQKGALRPLSWQELVMRLAAARDARAALCPYQHMSPASFITGATGLRRLSHGRSENDERDINPDALGHGKPNDGRSMNVARNAVTADRENI